MLETGLGREEEDQTCNRVGAPRKSAKEQISMVNLPDCITDLKYATRRDCIGDSMDRTKVTFGSLCDPLNLQYNPSYIDIFWLED
jgi:hypothetical protein